MGKGFGESIKNHKQRRRDSKESWFKTESITTILFNDI